MFSVLCSVILGVGFVLLWVGAWLVGLGRSVVLWVISEVFCFSRFVFLSFGLVGFMCVRFSF